MFQPWYFIADYLFHKVKNFFRLHRCEYCHKISLQSCFWSFDDRHTICEDCALELFYDIRMRQFLSQVEWPEDY